MESKLRENTHNTEKFSEVLLSNQKVILEMLAMGLTLQDILIAICKIVEGLFENAYCAILILDKQTNTFNQCYAPSLPEEYMKFIKGSSIGPQEATSGRATHLRKPVFSEDPFKEPSWDIESKRLKIKASWANPILSMDGSILGSFTIYSKRKGLPNKKVKEAIQVFTRMASITIEQKRIESELKTSQALYQSLVDNLPQNIMTKDLSGKFTFANTNFCKSLGKPLKEIINKTDYDFYPKDLAKKYIEDDKKVIESGKTFEDIEEHKDPNGEKVFVHVVKTPIFDSKGEVIGVQCIFWQVKRFSKALEESEEKFRKLIETANDAIFIVDVDTEKIIEVNKKAEEIIKLDAKELIGTHFSELHPEEEKEYGKQLFTTCTKEGSVSNKELKLITSDNKIIDAEISASLTEINGKKIVQGIFRDHSKIKKAEEELKRKNIFLNSIIENIPHMIFLKDAEELRFALLNKAETEILGFNKEALLGKTDYDIFSKDKADFFRKADMKTLERKTLLDIKEEVVETKDGERILHTKKIPILDQDENPIYLLGISEDITEQKKMQNQLIQSEKLSSIGLLGAGVAHELNSPLAGLLTFLRLRRKDVKDNKNEEMKLTAMIEACEYMAKIISDLTAFARETKSEFTELNLNEVIDSTLSFSSQQLTKQGVSVKKEYSKDLFLVHGDKGRLQQVILNMITNAWSALPDGGGFTIKTYNSVKENKVIMEFADNGQGIKKKDLRNIFDAFFTTKDQGKGTGLGLFVTKGIIDNHNGEIEVESEPDLGTKFTIKLPALCKI